MILHEFNDPCAICGRSIALVSDLKQSWNAGHEETCSLYQNPTKIIKKKHWVKRLFRL